MQRLKTILSDFGITESGILRFSDCEIVNDRLIKKLDFEPKSICICLLPYYTEYCDEPKSVSAYALSYDYHKLIESLAKYIRQEAEALLPDNHIAVYGDHSPINEKLAAARAGLGIIGSHSLLITEKYSSFVFLFEIITDIECEVEPFPVRYCENCGSCTAACPSLLRGLGPCVSALTQKKGTLSDYEMLLIKNAGTVWGCDLCQIACPYTKRAIEKKTIYTSLDWFRHAPLHFPTAKTVLDEEDFASRAYSWRGKDTILRNIEIINPSKESKKD